MSDTKREFANEYTSALFAYLKAQEEEALQRAYELGRKAISDGLGALDIVSSHQEALSKLTSIPSMRDLIEPPSKPPSTFLLESLAAFEMTHRGFLEALVTLSQRTLDLGRANQQLEAEIVERREIEAALLKREGQLAEAQEVAHIGSWDWDIEGNTISWTDELYHLFGMEPRSHLTYDHYLDAVHPEDRAMIDETVRRSVATHERFEFDHRVLKPNGAVCWIHSIGNVVVGAKGKAIHMIGTAQDITERKRAEEALQRSEELFRSLVENSSDIVTILNQDGTVRYESPSLERVVGYTSEELVGKNVFDYVHPEDAPELIEVFRSGIQIPGFIVARAFRFRHKDGNWRVLESVGKNLLDVPGISGVLVTSRDITEKLRLQEQLDEAARRRAEDAKLFASNVQRVQEEERQRLARELHDDICQRLTAMRLHVNLLEDEVSPTNAGGREQLGTIKHQVDGMITDIRRMSANLRPMALDLFGIETSLRMLCEGTRKTHKAQVLFSADVKGDAKYGAHTEIALYRIAQEALSNCIKHSGASEITLSLSNHGTSITMVIQDNGNGFTPEAHPQPKPLGTGYGLVNMRERTELLGGTFQLESSPGTGTTIRIEIPMSTP